MRDSSPSQRRANRTRRLDEPDAHRGRPVRWRGRQAVESSISTGHSFLARVTVSPRDIDRALRIAPDRGLFWNDPTHPTHPSRTHVPQQIPVQEQAPGAPGGRRLWLSSPSDSPQPAVA